MDFIRVTLFEKLESGKKPSELNSMPDYLLPLSGIKSLTPKPTTEDTYIINFCESYLPTNIGFTVGYAEARLPSDFINEINK